jgi:hypothetical protein
VAALFRELGLPRVTSEAGERVAVLRVVVVARGAGVVARELARRDELGCAREIVGTPDDVVRVGAGR